MPASDSLHFVLVHGAWHGAWCWEKVLPLIEQAGHQAHTLDLPGLGEDQTPIADVTLDAYVSAVIRTIDSVAQNVVLVGHSMGGMVITQVAEKIPAQIDSLIYLTAFSPRHRETLFQYANEDTESDVARYKELHEEEGYFLVAEKRLQDCFYGLCSQQDADAAISRLRPQALAPIATPLRLSEANYGSVRRCYIDCTQDRAISHAMQLRMRDNARLDAALSLNTDHSPFYSCPEELVEGLVSLS